MQITVRDYIKTFPKLEKEFDGSAMCAMKWIHQYIHLGHGVVKGCHNVPHRYISQQEVEKYGKDIFFNHPYEVQRRDEKLKNMKHSDCQACWNSEERQVRSCRLPTPFYDLHRQRFGGDGLTAMPTQLELAFSNVCDLKCIYCNSTFSSQWEAEEKKFNIFVERQTTAPHGFVDTFWQWLEEDAVENILQYYVLGGEPLIQQEFYDFLARLIPLLRNNPNRFNIKPELIIVTNAHAPEKYLKKWFEVARDLNDVMTVQMDISLEGYGNRAEYIRSNLNWKRFANNVDSILEFSKGLDTEIRFSITHSVMSITSCLDLLKWIKQLKDKHDVPVDLIRTSVASPMYLAPWMLTPNFGIYIDDVCDWIMTHAPEWSSYTGHLIGIKNSFGTHSKDHLQLFVSWQQGMLTKRGLDASKIFPEMKQWLEYTNEN